MIQLIPGTDPEIAYTHLTNAAYGLGNLTSSGPGGLDRLNAFRTWSNSHMSTLSSVLSPATMDRLVTTRQYWALQTLDPAAYGAALLGFVDQILKGMEHALHSAAEGVKQTIEIWSPLNHGQLNSDPKVNAVVLDTNVLLRHSWDLGKVDWYERMNSFPHEAVVLIVPIVVVDELDGLKNSNQNMHYNGQKHATSTLARSALRTLDSMFLGSAKFHNLPDQSDSNPARLELSVMLLMDDPSTSRQVDADLQIIDCAAGISSYVSRVAVATYDHAMIFRARHAGIEGFMPTQDLAK